MSIIGFKVCLETLSCPLTITIKLFNICFKRQICPLFRVTNSQSWFLSAGRGLVWRHRQCHQVHRAGCQLYGAGPDLCAGLPTPTLHSSPGYQTREPPGQCLYGYKSIGVFRWCPVLMNTVYMQVLKYCIDNSYYYSKECIASSEWIGNLPVCSPCL